MDELADLTTVVIARIRIARVVVTNRIVTALEMTQGNIQGTEGAQKG